MPRPEHLELAADQGVGLSMQPPFAGAFVRRGLARLVGPERAEWRHPYRRIVDLGILVAGGSESDCASLNPWPAMAGLLAHPDDDRRLNVYELLQLYTTNGARIAFEEDMVGKLQPGRRADLVVLGGDPTTLGADELARSYCDGNIGRWPPRPWPATSRSGASGSSFMIAQTVVFAQGVVPMLANMDALGGPGGVAIADGRILVVGPRAEIESTVDSGTRIHDFPSATILPGLIDSHVHFTSLGMNLLGPTVADCHTIAQVMERVADVVHAARAGDGLLFHGFSMADLEPPISGADLDRVAPDKPVLLIDQGGHGSVINRRGVEAIQLDASCPGVRRAQAGEPSGELVDEANMFARRLFEGYVTDDQRREAHRLAAAHALSVGLTTVHALQQVERIEALMDQSPDLPVRTVIYPQTPDVERVLEWGLPRLGGCLLVDGTYLQRTTALLEPYAGESTERGALYFSDESLARVFESAHGAGLQIAVHAIGDAAIGQALRAYARVLADDPRHDHRHRIEHFSLPLPEHIDQAAELGLALGMQPIFANQATVDAVAALLGRHRIKRRHPYRRILDSGLLVGGGSDADAAPLNPLFGIHEVVNHPEPERRLSIVEALQLFTLNAAKLAFEVHAWHKVPPVVDQLFVAKSRKQVHARAVAPLHLANAQDAGNADANWRLIARSQILE